MEIHNESKVSNSSLTAKFYKKFPLEDEDVWLLVSLENLEKQSGSRLIAFFELLKRHCPHKKAKILITDTLNEHYYGLERATELGMIFRERNGEILKKYQAQIVMWDVLRKSNDLENRRNELKAHCKENEEYRFAFEGIAKSHSQKAGQDQSLEYLFEECALLSTLNGKLCYPSENLNNAIQLSFKLFQSNISYHGYFLYDQNSFKKNKQSSPIKDLNNNNNKESDNEFKKTFRKFCFMMERQGIVSYEDQKNCFEQFLIEKFSDKTNERNGNLV